MTFENPLIEAKNLKKYFPLDKQHTLKAVDDISFALRSGETLGLVGESGCGKSTAGRTLVNLYSPTGGSVFYKGKDVAKLKRRELREFTREAQMIFQDPYASLDPRMTVGDTILEGIDIHRLASGKERLRRVQELLEMVGLRKEHADRYPYEFSGGQRQRIGIARALAVEPKLMVCDEPTSALDVSIQAQVVNLLNRLQKNLGLTYLFISHDLNMVKYISDRVAVMYLGVMVEIAPSEELYSRPEHPYTKALLSAIPLADPCTERQRQRILLEGDVPSPVNPPRGCRFQDRCSSVQEICRKEQPFLKEGSPGHWTACHLR